jgi:phosphoglycolate phosphatase
MKNEAIIFDIDGTLWNACLATAKGWSAGLSKMDINKIVFPEDIECLAGNTIEASVDILFPGLRARYPEAIEILSEHEVAAFQSEGGIFYEGVISGIKELSGSYKIFLVSNCPDWYMKIFIEQSRIGRIFEGFDCYGLSGMTKDKMLARLKNRYSLKNPVYVGDTAGDEEAANLANIEFIHVSYGFGSPKNEVKNFGSFRSLVRYFGEMAVAGN